MGQAVIACPFFIVVIFVLRQKRTSLVNTLLVRPGAYFLYGCNYVETVDVEKIIRQRLIKGDGLTGGEGSVPVKIDIGDSRG
jgi:hypothetical protein